MTIESARDRLDDLGSPSGYCFPLALDAVMRRTDLPQKYYELFAEGYRARLSDYDERLSVLLREFYGVEPAMNSDEEPLAEYNAYGASVQTYMPDSPYNYEDTVSRAIKEAGVTDKQLRMRDLLRKARINRCNVLFSAPGNNGREHVAGLELVDTGGRDHEAAYLVRNALRIENNRTYNEDELSGISSALGIHTDNYAPLPEFSREYYSDDATSWELTILPPEPTR